MTAAIGWTDIDFEPSRSIRSAVRGGLAETDFGVEFPRGDEGLMVGYGLGLKVFLKQNVAIRGEARGKSYDFFDERRNDREYSLGISFFAPGLD